MTKNGNATNGNATIRIEALAFGGARKNADEIGPFGTIRLSGTPVFTNYWGSEAIPLTDHRLDKAGFFGVIAQCRANLADSSVDAVV